MNNFTLLFSYTAKKFPDDSIGPGGYISGSLVSLCRFPLLILFILVLFLLLPSVSNAAAKYWVGGGGGGTGSGFYWDDGANWSGGTAPVDGDEIYFDQTATIIFERMPVSASYNKLYINQAIVSFRPYNITSSTLTIGDGNPNTVDLYIGPGKDLFLGHDWGLSQIIVLTPNSKAVIDGRLTIFHASTYNTDAAGAVTTVNYSATGGVDYNGRIDNYGACLSTASSHLIFNSQTRYAHINNNPTVLNNHTVPIASWNLTSTCWIQWFNPNTNPFVAGNLNQAFGNFIWDVAQRSNLVVSDILTTINGNLNVNNTGGYNLQLTNASSAPLNIGGTLTVAGSSSLISTVSIDGSTVNIGGTLQLSNNTKSGAINHSGGTVNINGGFIINTGCSYTCSNLPAINLKGNLTNNGSYIQANETFTLNGSAIQSIGGSKPSTFNILTISNPAGIIINTNCEVSSLLAFNSGKITTSGSNTTMRIGVTANLTGAGAGKYVNGILAIEIPANTVSKVFDIGDAVNYTPVTLTFSGTATNATGVIFAKTTLLDHPNIASTGPFGIDPAKSVNRYFTLTNSGVTFGTYSASFTFINPGDLDAGADPLVFAVQRFVPSSWYNPTAVSQTSTTTQFTGALPTEFGDFQLGQIKCAVPTIQSLTGVKSYCDPATNVEISLPGSEAGVNYQLKLDGTNIGSPVGGGGSVVNFGTYAAPGTYTILATRVRGGCHSTMSGSATLP